MSVSVVSGRWGPCCSVEPTGMRSVRPDPARRATSGQVNPSSRFTVPTLGRGAVRIRRPVEVAVADQEADQLVGRLGAPHRPDDGRRIVGHQCAGQGQQAEPRIGSLRGRQHPGPGREGPARADLDLTSPALGFDGLRGAGPAPPGRSSPRRPGRRPARPVATGSRPLPPSTPRAAAPAAARASRRRVGARPPGPRRRPGPPRAPPARGPGRRPARGPEMRGGPRCPDRPSGRRTAPARLDPMARWRRPACGPARARRLPTPVRTRARSRGRARGSAPPRRRGRPPRGAPARRLAGPAATANSRPDHALADAQRVLECGPVGGGEADAPGVPAHRAGERIDLRPQVGDPEAGHHQGAVPVVHRCTHPWWKTTP